MAGKDYAYFIEIARQQSILTASEMLFVTPSTLSKYVQRLEKTLSVKLFDRVGKKLIPTYAGTRYLEWCIKMDQIDRECENDMQRIVKEGQKTLRLGFPFMRVKHFLTEIIPEFCELYPNVDLSFFERNTSAIWPMFFQNELDVIFMYKDPSLLSEAIRYEPISAERLVLCVPKDHPLCDLGEKREGFDYPWIDIRRCAGEKVIVITNSVQDVIGSIEERFIELVPDVKIVMRTMSFESIAIAVSQGIGISIMSDHLVRLLGYADKVCMLSFGESQVECQYRAFFRENPSTSSEVQALIRIAKQRNIDRV